MRFKVKHDLKRARTIAARWGVDIQSQVAETRRAHVYRAISPQGKTALKLYKEIGASGEGAGIQFMRDLPSHVGPHIYRINFRRTAVLMEWLDGQPIQKLVASGDDDGAVKNLATIANAIQATNFRYRFIYKRAMPNVQRKFASYAATLGGNVSTDLKHAMCHLDHLAKTTTTERVIHGDLHFENVILTPKGPRMIDPKGLRCDPAFEFAKSLCRPFNNISVEEFADRTKNRADICAENNNFDPLRIIQWAVVRFAPRTFHQPHKRTDNLASQPYLKALLDLAEGAL